MVDVGIKGKVAEVARVGDVEVEAFMPDWTEIFLFQSGAKFLTLKLELHINTGRIVPIFGNKIMRTHDLHAKLEITHGT